MLERLYKPNKIMILISIAAFVIAIMVILSEMSQVLEALNGHTVTPDSDFFYSTSRLNEIKQSYTQEGIDAYVWTRFTYDFLWPVIYVFFMVATLGILIGSQPYFTYIKVLPFLAVAFDFLENIMCSVYFQLAEHHVIAHIASVSSALKWLLIVAVLLVQIVLFIRWAIKRIS